MPGDPRGGCGGSSPHVEVSSKPPRVLVLTRVGCHLCDQAVAVVAQVCADTGEDYATQDIDATADLQHFSDEVPVTFVDGAQHDFWRVDPARLKKALSRRRPG